MLAFFTNLSLREFKVRYLALFLLLSLIRGFGWLWMRNLHKNAQLMLKIPQGSIQGSILYMNDLPDDVICDIAIYADDTTLYSKCDHVSDMW